MIWTTLMPNRTTWKTTRATRASPSFNFFDVSSSVFGDDGSVILAIQKRSDLNAARFRPFYNRRCGDKTCRYLKHVRKNIAFPRVFFYYWKPLIMMMPARQLGEKEEYAI